MDTGMKSAAPMDSTTTTKTKKTKKTS
jgi:hypothetical protein